MCSCICCEAVVCCLVSHIHVYICIHITMLHRVRQTVRDERKVPPEKQRDLRDTPGRSLTHQVLPEESLLQASHGVAFSCEASPHTMWLTVSARGCVATGKTISGMVCPAGETPCEGSQQAPHLNLLRHMFILRMLWLNGCLFRVCFTGAGGTGETGFLAAGAEARRYP
jgi:hypothetical protein